MIVTSDASGLIAVERSHLAIWPDSHVIRRLATDAVLTAVQAVRGWKETATGPLDGKSPTRRAWCRRLSSTGRAARSSTTAPTSLSATAVSWKAGSVRLPALSTLIIPCDDGISIDRAVDGRLADDTLSDNYHVSAGAVAVVGVREHDTGASA